MRALRELVAKKYDAFTRRKGGSHRKLETFSPPLATRLHGNDIVRLCDVAGVRSKASQ